MALSDVVIQATGELIDLVTKLAGWKFGKSKTEAKKIENKLFWFMGV